MESTMIDTQKKEQLICLFAKFLKEEYIIAQYLMPGGP